MRTHNTLDWILRSTALGALIFLGFAPAGFTQDQSSSQTSAQIGYKVAEGSELKKTLLLRDFKPQPTLHRTLHPVARAKFPVFDVHQHVNDAMGIEGKVPPAELIQRMNTLNIKTIVILTGMWGDKLQHVIDENAKAYPGRLLVFTQIDWGKIDDPDFSAEMVRQIDDGVRRGARGLKVLKDLGLGIRDKTGKLITVDDARLDPVWDECGRLGIPVFIHSADPEAFFHPIDATNELYEALIEHPDWSFYGKDFPTMQSLLDARNRVFAKHPETKFVSLHMGWPENLDWVEHMLATYPNVYTEFGAREGELGRQPRRTRKLFIDYQDRIMFGTDTTPDAEMYQNVFEWLETSDEYFDYTSFPENHRWKIYGLELPDPVLEKIYHLNADKLFSKLPAIPQ